MHDRYSPENKYPMSDTVRAILESSGNHYLATEAEVWAEVEEVMGDIMLDTIREEHGYKKWTEAEKRRRVSVTLGFPQFIDQAMKAIAYNTGRTCGDVMFEMETRGRAAAEKMFRHRVAAGYEKPLKRKR